MAFPSGIFLVPSKARAEWYAFNIMSSSAIALIDTRGTVNLAGHTPSAKARERVWLASWCIATPPECLHVEMATPARVLVYGGKGALGSAVVAHFKARDWVREGRTCLRSSRLRESLGILIITHPVASQP